MLSSGESFERELRANSFQTKAILVQQIVIQLHMVLHAGLGLTCKLSWLCERDTPSSPGASLRVIARHKNRDMTVDTEAHTCTPVPAEHGGVHVREQSEAGDNTAHCQG